ncbi:MAG: CPBP family intramembrane metalloprotease [Ruminococcus sp.]|uniref:CPBP family intramembrane glutamic endopeptidase n=1 Tax=Ruminococcus sp. TaxID=41978 RepID=UPI0025DD2FF8|nr:CPBP family intramembrane glutamic endopeptidase [Ruminococcus sp.]MBR5682080.1 CPBP family intramembrane metalloprotease [Ruminococcus sp.]
MLDYRPKMFSEASKSHASKNIFIILLCFLAVFIVILLLESVVPAVVTLKPMIEELRKQGYLDSGEIISVTEATKLATKVASAPKVMVPTLLSTGFGTLAAIFYCRCIEMRPVRSMGARKNGFFSHYFSGLLCGLIMMSAIALLSAALGINRIKLCSNINFGIIALFLLGFIVQGMSEEFIFRGYLMTTIGGSGKHTAVAVLISSVGFALAHAGNPGFGPLPFVNLFLFGAFAALCVVIFDNIWGACAIHSIWNFAQGNLYGISVSGSADAESVLRSVPQSSHAFLTGGKFGIEGSIVTTVILGIGIASELYMLSKKTPETEPAPAEAE